MSRPFDRLIPALVFIVLVAAWEGAVRLAALPPYVLPSPSLIARTLVADWAVLSASLWVTLRITALALALATGIGVAL
ncbi:MAG: transporter ATP-binding protein, partial [Hyphomicrobiales bacterium]|nr:transporter ATP-binding protein [Hyphomicrobiales bacterium]